MTRKAALVTCRVAGYHDDTRSFVRAYVENRVSYAAARVEWAHGVRLKASGYVCDCFHCRKAQGLA